MVLGIRLLGLDWADTWLSLEILTIEFERENNIVPVNRSLFYIEFGEGKVDILDILFMEIKR